MNLELTDEHLALRSAIRGFLTDKASVAEHVRPLLDGGGTTAGVRKGLADLGATGLLVPAEYGGAGLTMVEAGLVAEELGAALYPESWRSTAVAAPRALTRFGVEVHAPELLTGIADGTVTAAVGPLTGPLPGLHAVGPDTVIRGEIAELADADTADVILVLCDAGDQRALCVVPASRVTVSPVPCIDPTLRRFRVRFDDAVAQVIGMGDGSAIEALTDDVLTIAAAEALGAAQRLLDMTVEHAKKRSQFGQPIGSFQAVQHLCVGMFQTVELARGGVMHALWASDRSDRTDQRRAAARLKAFGPQLAAVGDNAIQVFGGIGYTWEHDAHLYLRRLLAYTHFLGGTDLYLEQLGAALISEIGQERRTE